MSTEDTGKAPLIERVLAYAAISIIVVALGSFFATLIVGLANRHTLAEGLWQFVYNISLIGLPIGFVLIVALLILTQSRRSREFREQSENTQKKLKKSNKR